MTSPITTGQPPYQMEESLAVLRIMALAVGLPFDETRARQALRQAVADIPPTANRATRRRLTQAARVLGLQIHSQQLSVREAIAVVQPDAPLTTFAAGSSGVARWHVLLEGRGGRARLARLETDDPQSWLKADEVARRIGAVDADAVVEWLFAQPVSPLLPEEAVPGAGAAAPERHAHGPAPFVRLLKLVRPDRRELWVVFLYAAAVGVLSLAVPVTLMAVVNTVALATLIQQLIVLCVALLVCMVFVALLRTLQFVVVEYIQRRIFVRVAADLAYRLPRVNLSAFDRQYGPELVNRFFEVLTAQKASAVLLLDGIDVALHAAVGLILLASYHQALLGFDLVLLAALVFLVWPLGNRGVATAVQESHAKYAVVSWLEDMARHPRAFKLCSTPTFALEQTDLLTRNYLLARHAHFRVVLRQFAFALGLYALATTSLLALGGYLVITGSMTLGQLVAAEVVVSLMVFSLTKLGKHAENYYDLMAAVEKLGHLIDLPLEREGGVGHLARTGGSAVRICQVSYTYDHGHRPVLHEFSLELAPGERVALLGPNGAGKSTLADLLFGLRAPTHGFIEIDGIDLRDVKLESLREHVAIVKGIEIVQGTIYDNVRMGREFVTHGDVIRALRAVALLEDVQDFPEGVHTVLSADGAPLSLGQTERLMLARAIAGQPRLLVLDELLDDMDRAVRAEVLPALFGPSARWTLLVITHSPEVAALCTRQVRIERLRPDAVAESPSGVKHLEVSRAP